MQPTPTQPTGRWPTPRRRAMNCAATKTSKRAEARSPLARGLNGLSGLLALALTACASATPVPPTVLPTVGVMVRTVTPPPPLASPTVAPSPTASPQPPTALLPSPQPLTPSPASVASTPDAEAATRAVSVPILMYHYIEPWPADADDLRKGLTVQPDDFAAQMAYLHDHGYTSIRFEDLTNALATGAPLPEKPVILTFDDGYRTLADYAVPLAEAQGFHGTIFVITQFTDERLSQYLTWEQAEALYAQGWDLQPHTKTHESLTGRDRDFQLYQMLGSIQTIAAHTGRYPRYFAYPIGHYDDLSVQLAGELGLWGAVTTAFGRTHTLADQFTWTRVRVDGRGTLQDFVNAVGESK